MSSAKPKYSMLSRVKSIPKTKNKYLRKYSNIAKLYVTMLRKQWKKRRGRRKIWRAYSLYAVKQRKVIKTYSKRNKKLTNKKFSNVLNKYRKRFTSKLSRKRIWGKLRHYKAWRANYVRLKTLKSDVIKRFFSLFKSFHTKRAVAKQPYQVAFVSSWRTQKRILYHPKAFALREKWRAEHQQSINKARFEHKAPVNKRQFYRFAFGKSIAKLKRQKKNRKRKLLLGTYRLNFIFKKVLRKILKIDDKGSVIVRFLQPDRLLLSTKRLRKIARRHYVISRYRRQRMYKRVLPFIAIMFRYWNAQPLIEQIAFEMEKTKKHWPILRTIRAIVQYLKPTSYSGYRIAVRGKISSSKRTRTFYIRDGRLPINTFQTRMTYAFYQSNARIGSFGLKSWIYFSA